MCCGDLANVFKAFIGSNYLSLPFAFQQGGLVLSIGMLFLVAFLTDYCCGLLVIVKRTVVKNVFEALNDPSAMRHLSTSLQSANKDDVKEVLQFHLQMRQVAKYTLGKWGEICVSASLFITQFGFCASYFIFIGNTLFELVSSPLSPNISSSSVEDPINSLSETFSSSNDKMSSTNDSWLLYYLVAAPLPIFIFFSFLRNMRQVAKVSFMANIAILGGYFIILGFMLYGIEMSPDVSLYEWKTLPVFLGSVFGSFEGIGTILTIEAGMKHNRPKFHRFLHVTLVAVTLIFITFGAVGYIRFGRNTAQIIVQNLPTDSALTMIVDISLIIAIGCTYPLQLYPVVELLEQWVLSPSVSTQKVQEVPRNPSDYSEFGSLEDTSLQESTEPMSALVLSAFEITERAHLLNQNKGKIAQWKRYLLRVIVVLSQMLVALLAKDLFGYFGSFVGALGSSFLSYIFPSLAFMRLHWNELSKAECFKHILIISFASISSLLSMATNLSVIINRLT